MDKGAEYYRLFQSGSNEGIEKIILEYRAGLQAFLGSLTGDAALAEELTQETFVKIFTTRPKYYAKASFRTWLYTVGRNITLNELRRRGRTAPLTETDDSLPSAENVEETVEQAQRQKAVRSALRKLPSPYAEVLWLTYFEELPSREIARILKKTPHNVDVLRGRAKNMLREQLRKDGFTDENQ